MTPALAAPIRARLPALILAAATSLASPGRAQVADSAAAARVHWRAAVTALRAGDTSTALAAVQRAAVAWPAQPAYQLNTARLAAASGRPAVALDALERLARM
ncbi:MAG TPA: hypothetical protein VFX50_00235, partial [Gemmatimonadales bacterium]|nr:hypothetical protein [Gemmatimonadales bacterium]